MAEPNGIATEKANTLAKEIEEKVFTQKEMAFSEIDRLSKGKDIPVMKVLQLLNMSERIVIDYSKNMIRYR